MSGSQNPLDYRDLVSEEPRNHPWLLTTLALLTTVTAVVSSLGAPLVPLIATETGVSLHAAQWTLTAALLSGAVATPLLGRAGGGRRRRPVVLGGMVAVTVGAGLSALPLGYAGLVTGRALQGVGLGLTPLAIAAAREAVPAARLPRTVALLSVTTVAGAGLGYPLTGLVADLGGVAAAYGLGFGLCLATLAMAWRFLPAADSADDGRLDLVGAALLTTGTLGVLLAISQAGTWTLPLVGALAVGGAAVLAVWVPTTLRSAAPLVDLRLLRHRPVAAANLTAVAAGIGMYTALTLVVVLVQDDDWGLGRSVAVSGLLLVPYAVFSVAGSRVAVALGRRSPGAVLPLGCLLYVASAVLLVLAHGSMTAVLLAMAVAGMGSGGTFAALPGLIVPHVPPDETGSALAFNQVLRYLGFSLGATLSIALLAAGGPGASSEQGWTVAMLAGAGVMLLAALLNVVLSVLPSPTPRTGTTRPDPVAPSPEGHLPA